MAASTAGSRSWTLKRHDGGYGLFVRGFRGVVLAIVAGLVISCFFMGPATAQQAQQGPSYSMSGSDDKLPAAQIENWALSFGSTLWEIARQATRFDSLQKRFHAEGATAVEVDGFKMVQAMAANVEIMMQHKIDAIKRIMEFAENLALDHKFDKDLGHALKESPNNGGFHYLNTKKINIIDDDDEEPVPDWDKYLSATDRMEDDERFRIGYTRIPLESNKYFSGIPVNTNTSVVHVPTNVFDGDPKVINSIKWSRGLDRVFIDNYNRDPTLSWQYFGSSAGFMRQYPAMKWLMNEHEPDLYDARMRDWYIKAAASPKEIVILLDSSGSMTGLRKEIAKHVVLNILETLGEDDFVTIYKFSKTPTPLVECFTVDGRAELVQATNENIREFQEAVQKITTEEIANFTSALTVAFELLRDSFNDPEVGANCNQAIMLVTDGVPYRYEEIFKQYNHNKRVRVFTYLIGREISDLKAANWMACANKGYFTHVTTLAEVKEQVLKYIPVMARPMVMYRDKHPIQWTGVYADIEDPKTSRWLWDLKERSRQRRRTENYREIMRMQQKIAEPLAKLDSEDESAAARENQEKLTKLSYRQELDRYLSYGKWDLTDSDIERIQKDEENRQRLIREISDAKTQRWTLPPKDLSYSLDDTEKKSKFTGFRLMTSVSIPVFDKKNHTDPEILGLKKSPEAAFLRKVRIAELLGVAGTDVPIREIEKLTPPDQLGVNGYSFAVNNNGYILFHPDLRPMFQDILRPNYNSVDLTEVELTDAADSEPRGNDSELLFVRKDMVNQVKGQTYLRVKQHFDDMKRATIRTQDYFYHPLSNTPFSLGIALPRDYGRARVNGKIEVSLAEHNISEKFADSNWRVHPDWVYCEYNYAGNPMREFATPEETIRHFAARSQTRGWNWGTPSVPPLPKCTNKEQFDPDCSKCNRDLMQSLIFDAVVTHDFQNAPSGHHNQGGRGSQIKTDESQQDDSSDEEDKNVSHKRFGIHMSFVATRSGLLRFSDYSDLFKDPYEKSDQDHDDIKEPHFADINNKATEEVWYRRAVDYHKINSKSFVFSVPFDVGAKRTRIMGTHAIMVGKSDLRAPAAVVGVQIDSDIFRELFVNVTGKCSDSRSVKECPYKTCASEDVECYVIDNNGFVIIAENKADTGKFFGEVDGTILESLVQSGVYKRIKIYDYQAICLETEGDGSSSSIIMSPFKFISWIFNTLLSQIAYTLIRFEIHHLWNPDWTYAMPQQQPPFGENEATVEDGDDGGDGGDSPGYDDYDNDDSIIDTFSVKDGGPIPLLQMTYINKTVPKPCDKEVNLYELNEEKLYKDGKLSPVKGTLTNCHESRCERPFIVQLIPHTNLVFIVADKLCPCFSNKISITPTKVDYGATNETSYCEMLKYNIWRRKPTHCVNYHAEETEIKLCGHGSRHIIPVVLLSLSILFTVIQQKVRL